MNQPRVYCLCPTYCREDCLASSLYLFQQQTYPNRILYILDDAGQYIHTRGKDYVVLSGSTRFPSIMAKYAYLMEILLPQMDDSDIICFWEDDDIYLPRYIEGVVRAIQEEKKPLAKHFKLYSYYQDQILLIDGLSNIYFSTWAVTAELARKTEIPKDKKANADQVYISRLLHNAGYTEQSQVADSSRAFGIQFIYRFTGVPFHASSFMTKPDDEHWYDLVPQYVKPTKTNILLRPKLGKDVKELIDRIYRKSSDADQSAENTRLD